MNSKSGFELDLMMYFVNACIYLYLLSIEGLSYLMNSWKTHIYNFYNVPMNKYLKNINPYFFFFIGT